MTDSAMTGESSHELAIGLTERPARIAANDDSRDGRMPPPTIEVPHPANDDLPPLPVKDMRAALPLPEKTDEDVYAATCEHLSHHIEEGEYKVRSIAKAIEAQRRAGLPLASHGGVVSWEPLGEGSRTTC